MKQDKELNSINTKTQSRPYLTLFTHVAICVATYANIAIDKKSANNDKIILAVIVFLLGLLGFLRFLNLRHLKKKNGLLIGLYYFLSLSGLIFFAPIGSTFTFVWLLLMFFALTHFEIKSAMGSLLILAGGLEMQLLWQSHVQDRTVTLNSAAIVLIQLAIIGAVLALSLERKNINP